eukprot:TRINITY_DN157_c0_g2_i1.p1 TRINITY_DN157_c0_g2~~TRINITY_DN157_c0_g2_i1.p1  ORF type:complete len:468 (-),score=82.68 TRINITY_DN157_c0_g2_i1:127-1530(-)
MKQRTEDRRNKLKTEKEESEDQFVLKQPVLESVTNTITLTYDRIPKPPSPARKVKKSFTAEKALPMSRWVTPGPGYYDTVHEYDSERIKNSYKAVCFNYHGTVRKHESELKSILGPGSHTLPEENCAPLISFSGRVDPILVEKAMKVRRKLIPEDKSQPDFIEQVSSFGKSPVTKFNLLPRLFVKKSGVGPGSYNPVLPDYSNMCTIIKQRSKSVTRVKKTIPVQEKHKLDLEGVYKYLYASPGRSFGLLIKPKDSDTTPGPGTYDHEAKNPVIKKIVARRTPVKRRVPMRVPMIATIQVSRKGKVVEKKINGTFSKAPRDGRSPLSRAPVIDAKKSPPPTDKEEKKKTVLEVCTFGARPKKYIDTSPTPAPNAYSTDYLTASTRGAVLSRTGHTSLQQKYYSDKFYDTVDIYKGPAISFGSEKKDVTIRKTDLPGPGSYNTISYVGRVPEYAYATSKSNNSSNITD